MEISENLFNKIQAQISSILRCVEHIDKEVEKMDYKTFSIQNKLRLQLIKAIGINIDRKLTDIKRKNEKNNETNR